MKSQSLVKRPSCFREQSAFLTAGWRLTWLVSGKVSSAILKGNVTKSESVPLPASRSSIGIMTVEGIDISPVVIGRHGVKPVQHLCWNLRPQGDPSTALLQGLHPQRGGGPLPPSGTNGADLPVHFLENIEVHLLTLLAGRWIRIRVSGRTGSTRGRIRGQRELRAVGLPHRARFFA